MMKNRKKSIKRIICMIMMAIMLSQSGIQPVLAYSDNILKTQPETNVTEVETEMPTETESESEMEIEIESESETITESVTENETETEETQTVIEETIENETTEVGTEIVTEEFTEYCSEEETRTVEVLDGQGVQVASENSMETPEADFTWDDTTIVKYNGNASEVIIPLKATVIGEEAFLGNTSIESVVINKNVYKIRDNAFKDCSNLKTVNIDTRNVGNNCGKNVFSGCNISNVYFAEDMSSIPDRLFMNAGFESGTTIVIPEQIDTIGSYFLENVPEVEAIIFEGDDIWHIGECAFSGTGIRTINLPNKKLSGISRGMFSRCSNLVEITIPSHIKTIFGKAFKDCNNLKTVKFETANLDSYCESDSFSGCSLNNVEFAEGTTYIARNLFKNATFEQGASIVIPADVVEIGNSAFQNAENLKNITFAGDKLVKIGSYAFAGTEIERLELADAVKQIGYEAFCGSAIREITIPQNVGEIGISAFKDCSNLESVVYNAVNGLKCGDDIFVGCNISKVEIAQDVVHIPDRLFMNAGFSEGTSIIIPENVIEVGDKAFLNVSNLANVTFKGNNVKRIEWCAFAGTGIETVVLPKSLEKIGQEAFYECKNLQDIIIPSMVTQIDHEAFANCSALKSIKLENIQPEMKCGHNIFAGCSINKVEFPENVTYIPENLFMNATFEKGTCVIIPESVSVLGARAFQEAYNLEEVIFEGDKIKEIGEYTFYGTDMKEMILPSNLEVIGYEAFSSSAIQEIIIPQSVQYIDEGAFMDSALERVYLPPKVKYIHKTAFDKAYYLEIHALKNSSSYKWAKKNGYNVVDIYSISYKLNGGTNAEGNPDTYEQGDFIEFNAPTRSGYEFAGWYKDSACKKVFTYNEDMKVNLTLYAKWTPITYTINYEVNGGTLAKNTPVSYNATVAVTLKNPTRKGYTFTGWYTATELTAQSKIKSIRKGTHGDITLYAGWNENTYNIKFSPNGNGVKGTHSLIKNLGFDKEVVLDTCVYTRKGYVFKGWNTKANGKGIAIEDGASIKNLSAKHKSTITLYAMWEIVPYSITYNMNGGTNHKKNPDTYTVVKGITFSSPQKTGYTFKGWYTNADFAEESKIKSIKKGSTGNYVIYAKWQENIYSVKFAANGSGVSGKHEQIKNLGYEEEITLDACTYTRKGYVFKGWNTKANGKGIYVEDGATISRLSAKNKSTVTLYAMWEAIPYEITYYLDGGINHKKNPTLYTVAKGVTFLKPSKTGYTFKGWYLDEEFEKKITGIKKGSAENVTVYAKWEINKYTIKFNANKGRGRMSSLVNCEYDKSYLLPENVYKRNGYSFIGWNTRTDGKGMFYENGQEIQNLTDKNKKTITLYAQWKKN